MARFDVMPASPDVPIRWLPIAGSQTFYHGDPLLLDTTGLLNIATDGIASDAGVAGSPANTVSGVIVAASDSFTTTYPGGVATTASYAAGTLIPVYWFRPGDQAVCKNYSTDNAGTAAAINATNTRGLNGAFTVDASTPKKFFFDTGTTLALATLTRILPIATTSAGLGRYDDTATTSLAASSFVVVVTFTRDIT